MEQATRAALRSGVFTFLVPRVFARPASGKRSRAIVVYPLRDRLVLRALFWALRERLERSLLPGCLARRGNSRHGALAVMARAEVEGLNWAVVADVAGFFASVPRPPLIAALRAGRVPADVTAVLEAALAQSPPPAHRHRGGYEFLGMAAAKLTGALPAIDGSALTGVTDATKVLKAGDTMSGQLTIGGGAGAGGANSPGGGNGAAGGNGTASSISGSAVTYAGGGGGGTRAFNSGTGGAGGAGGGGAGGGVGGTAVAGTANTGGGGGGHGFIDGQSAAAGGSGIVIIRYPTP